MSPQSELLMRCGHPRPSIRLDDDHPDLDHAQFTRTPIKEDAPLPDKHALPPFKANADVLLLSALYEFGDIDQQGILTTSFTDADDDPFEWIEEDLYVIEFFKDIYPVQLTKQKPDHAVTLSVNVTIACLCPGGSEPVKWRGTGYLSLDFPEQKGALTSISLSNSTGSQFNGALAFTISPPTSNMFNSHDAKIQFQIDGGHVHNWNASIKGALNGHQTPETIGHFAASHLDLEAGLIGRFESLDE